MMYMHKIAMELLLLVLIFLITPKAQGFAPIPAIARNPLERRELQHVSSSISCGYGKLLEGSAFDVIRTTSSSALADTTIFSDPTTVQSFWQNTDVWVFVAGIFPFVWATVEFWRRIAFGESFGTGSDSIVIGMEDSPADSRGRRVLGKGALITAVVLFVLAFGTIGTVLYSVMTSDAPPEILPSPTDTTNSQ